MVIGGGRGRERGRDRICLTEPEMHINGILLSVLLGIRREARPGLATNHSSSVINTWEAQDRNAVGINSIASYAKIAL